VYNVHCFAALFCFFVVSSSAQQHKPNSPFYHGSRQENFIALTFDACPSSTHGGFEKQIVQTLIDSNVSATFFLSGRWVAKHPEEARWLASVPSFELGNHSYSHPHMTELSRETVVEELTKTQKLILKKTGVTPKLFRPPYMETNTQLIDIADSLGLQIVMYDLASGDPDTNITAQALIHYVIPSAKNGSIIVMHVNGRGWHTAEALPSVIAGLKKRGFRFVTVSELLEQ
jgi:peptidoglycan/xylan/chitin deacetylase (PgdA/CDA1 family)